MVSGRFLFSFAKQTEPDFTFSTPL